MAIPNYCVHPDQPSNCPSSEAKAVSQLLYRAIKGVAPALEDFISDVEKNRKGIDRSDCRNYGLSVWTTPEGVELARNIVPGFRKKCIVGFNVSMNDGVLLSTRTGNQGDHHYTFWREKTTKLHIIAKEFIARSMA